MMLDELSLVMTRVAPEATPDVYISAIVDENIPGKTNPEHPAAFGQTLDRTVRSRLCLYGVPAAAVLLARRSDWPAHAGVSGRIDTGPTPRSKQPGGDRMENGHAEAKATVFEGHRLHCPKKVVMYCGGPRQGRKDFA
jgi:hypothetical protein